MMFGVANATSGAALDSTAGAGRGLMGGGNIIAGLNFPQSASFCANCFAAYNDGGSAAGTGGKITYTFGTLGTFMGRFSASDTNPVKAYVNGGAAGTGSNTASTGMNIGIFFGCHRGCGIGTMAMNGSIAENYFFASEPSVAATNIFGANVAAYYGLSWTAITE